MPRTHNVHDISAGSKQLSRRDFLATATAALVATAGSASPNSPQAPPPYKGKHCFFSKALPQMDWRRLAQSVKQLGFDGIDLTVRKNGHVLPERVAEDLPKAVAAIREEGLDVPMITTALTSASDPAAQPILSTAARLGIHYFKAGYYYYQFQDVRKELEKAGREFRGLAGLAQQYGIQVGYHNHSEYIGAAVWDIADILAPLDPHWAGYYFDPRHAVAEGGAGAWKSALHLAASRLKMVAAKDCYWEKTAQGWRDTNCPLGEGMVDWKYVFGVLARAGFHGPISLHLEYEIAGAEPGVNEAATLAAAKRDLDFLKAHLQEAYQGAGR